jgi:RND family efflux transporter MFP subunit
MKSKIFRKNTLFALGKIIGASILVIALIFLIFKANSSVSTQVLEIKTVTSTIQADGQIAPQNQAVLHFQTGGKLIYLPFKEGDQVYQGQTIASLDTTKLQANLRQAEQNFIAAKAVSDKFYDGRDPNASESYDDKIKRTAIDAAQNIAYDNVVKARQDLSDAVLSSPMNGIILQEDVATVNVNVTPVTGFVVADPSSLTFRANVLENDIDFISIGNSATIKIGNESFSGIIGKIYPDKTTLTNSQKVYLVDIENDEFVNLKIDQAGTALIQSNSRENVKLVPTWTILNGDSIWVLAKNQAVLRAVRVGKNHGGITEIMDGLKAGDKVILNPESIAVQKYAIL